MTRTMVKPPSAWRLWDCSRIGNDGSWHRGWPVGDGCSRAGRAIASLRCYRPSERAGEKSSGRRRCRGRTRGYRGRQPLNGVMGPRGARTGTGARLYRSGRC